MKMDGTPFEKFKQGFMMWIKLYEGEFLFEQEQRAIITLFDYNNFARFFLKQLLIETDPEWGSTRDRDVNKKFSNLSRLFQETKDINDIITSTDFRDLANHKVFGIILRIYFGDRNLKTLVDEMRADGFEVKLPKEMEPPLPSLPLPPYPPTLPPPEKNWWEVSKQLLKVKVGNFKYEEAKEIEVRGVPLDNRFELGFMKWIKFFEDQQNLEIEGWLHPLLLFDYRHFVTFFKNQLLFEDDQAEKDFDKGLNGDYDILNQLFAKSKIVIKSKEFHNLTPHKFFEAVLGLYLNNRHLKTLVDEMRAEGHETVRLVEKKHVHVNTTPWYMYK